MVPPSKPLLFYKSNSMCCPNIENLVRIAAAALYTPVTLRNPMLQKFSHEMAATRLEWDQDKINLNAPKR